MEDEIEQQITDLVRKINSGECEIFGPSLKDPRPLLLEDGKCYYLNQALFEYLLKKGYIESAETVQ